MSRPLPPRLTIRRQAGMVSIMVTMIMMLVITLIVLGFATVSRREQRQQLDRQLSDQAFFAAESGVNDARQVIRTRQALGQPIPEKTTCPPDPTVYNATADPVLDRNKNISYTCLLVTTRLHDLAINPVTAGGDSVNVPLEPGSDTINTLHLVWTSPSSFTPTDYNNCAANVPGGSNWPRASDWKCPYGAVRIDIVPTDTLSRAALKTRTVFMYPTRNGAGTLPYSAANGATVAMKCNATNTIGCSLDITNLTGSTNYALRVSSLYQSGALDITATNATNDSLELKNAQIQVDATGKAQDVLRRIQVRLAMAQSGKTPDFALESASSICKRYEIGPGFFSIPNDIQQPEDQKNPMCAPYVIVPPCTNSPKDIAMVLDDSLTMKIDWTDPGSTKTYTRLSKLSEVATRFITEAFQANPDNRIAILPFNSDPASAPPHTNNNPPIRTPLLDSTNAATLNNAVSYTTLFSRNNCCTEYYYGLTYAQNALAAARPDAQKIIVFISDGEPTDGSSRTERQAIIDAKMAILKGLGYTVYTIGITNDSVKAAAYMQGMASTPSDYAFALNQGDLDTAINNVIGALGCNSGP